MKCTHSHPSPGYLYTVRVDEFGSLSVDYMCPAIATSGAGMIQVLTSQSSHAMEETAPKKVSQQT